jgi:hypothetical protein
MTIYNLQTELENLKRRSRNWLIALGVAVFIIIVLLITAFRKKEDNSKLRALEIQLEGEKARVKALEEKLPLYDSLLANQQRQLDNNRATETKIIHHYEKIPAAVRDLTREQLRSEVTNY